MFVRLVYFYILYSPSLFYNSIFCVWFVCLCIFYVLSAMPWPICILVWFAVVVNFIRFGHLVYFLGFSALSILYPLSALSILGFFCLVYFLSLCFVCIVYFISFV